MAPRVFEGHCAPKAPRGPPPPPEARARAEQKHTTLPLCLARMPAAEEPPEQRAPPECDGELRALLRLGAELVRDEARGLDVAAGDRGRERRGGSAAARACESRAEEASAEASLVQQVQVQVAVS